MHWVPKNMSETLETQSPRPNRLEIDGCMVLHLDDVRQKLPNGVALTFRTFLICTDFALTNNARILKQASRHP
jgi:hypothetical protein